MLEVVADPGRFGAVHDQAVADLVIGAEHDHVAGVLVGQAHLAVKAFGARRELGAVLDAVDDVAAFAPDREHGAVVDPLAGADRQRHHVARAAVGQGVGHGQHARAAVFELLLRRMREELQVVGLGVDSEQAVADADFAAGLVQQPGVGLDAPDFPAAPGADVTAHHLLTRPSAPLLGATPRSPVTARLPHTYP